MQSTHRGWVALGLAAMLGLHTIDTLAAQRTADTPQTLAQQGRSTGTEGTTPEKTVAPQSLYETLAERVHVGATALSAMRPMTSKISTMVSTSAVLSLP